MATRIQTLHEEVSSISGKIKVRQYYDVRELYVDDVKQSQWSDNELRFNGTYWGGVVSVPLPDTIIAPHVLMLGLGGGTIPKLLTKKYPSCSVLCIELDPVITRIAQEFFDLNKYANIDVVTADANRWLEENTEKYKAHFDVVCLDTYISDNFNFNTKNNSKVEQLISYLNLTGTLITNRIYDEENKKELATFKRNLQRYFISVNQIIIEGYSGCDNIILYGQTPHKSN